MARSQSKAYKHLWRINRAWSDVVQGLSILATHDAFDRRELERLRARVQEVQAATNSYLAQALDAVESTEAGRLIRRRIARERRDDAGRE